MSGSKCASRAYSSPLHENDNPLVSIIMPLYNAESFVLETIESVLKQSYLNWELIIVDDCSTDESYRVAQTFADGDNRILLFRNESNLGVAQTRNCGLERAQGGFVAFLDADDAWLPEKLQKQIDFMRLQDAAMCFTSYETIEADGSHRNYVHVPRRIDYKGFLKNTVTCSHTIMFDLSKVCKATLVCPSFEEEFDFPEDLVVWLSILKTGVVAYGLDEVLAKNRKHETSRSADKRRAVARTWNAYRKVEGLGFFYSAYCLIWQLYHAVLKRLR